MRTSFYSLLNPFQIVREKGISQLLLLRKAFAEQDPTLFRRVGIEPKYSIGFVVVSANWISYSSDQDPAVPVSDSRQSLRELALAVCQAIRNIPAIGR
jgi:hypothetical protein